VEQEPIPIGRRIAVWGVTGSGKTTLAKRLGEALNLGVVELDAIRHARGWDSTDWPEFREVLTERLDALPEGWVVEGSYSAIMDAYLSRIDTMVWIHLPFHTSFWRLLKRTVSRGITRTQLYTATGPHESLRLSFFSRRSILWWSISMHRRSTKVRRERIAVLPPQVRVYELRSAREVNGFVAALEEARREAPSASP
jgi:adenylate kinase family enzyme